AVENLNFVAPHQEHATVPSVLPGTLRFGRSGEFDMQVAVTEHGLRRNVAGAVDFHVAVSDAPRTSRPARGVPAVEEDDRALGRPRAERRGGTGLYGSRLRPLGIVYEPLRSCLVLLLEALDGRLGAPAVPDRHGFLPGLLRAAEVRGSKGPRDARHRHGKGGS